jgi:hypothetical protein
MKQPSGWGLIRSSCVCATLLIAIRTPVGHGAAIVCSNAITSAPSVSAGGGGPSKARPAAEGGGSVGGHGEHAVSRDPASQQGARLLGIRWVVAAPVRHAGHGLAHLFGARFAANGLVIPMSKVAVELGDTWLPDGPFFRWLASEGQHFPGGGYGDRETTHYADRHGSRRQGVTPCRPEDGVRDGVIRSRDRQCG